VYISRLSCSRPAMVPSGTALRASRQRAPLLLRRQLLPDCGTRSRCVADRCPLLFARARVAECQLLPSPPEPPPPLFPELVNRRAPPIGRGRIFNCPVELAVALAPRAVAQNIQNNWWRSHAPVRWLLRWCRCCQRQIPHRNNRALCAPWLPESVHFLHAPDSVEGSAGSRTWSHCASDFRRRSVRVPPNSASDCGLALQPAYPRPAARASLTPTSRRFESQVTCLSFSCLHGKRAS